MSKQKVTYAQVKKALEQGFVSPLTRKTKEIKEVVGRVFSHGKNNQAWEITRAECLKEFPYAAQAMIDNGKDAIHYHARKVLKSGKAPIQTGIFYRTSKDQFIKVL